VGIAAGAEGGNVALLDGDAEEPHMKLNRYLITGIVLALLIAIAVWYQFRFYSEKKAVDRFFTVLVTGDTKAAYEIWVPPAAREGQSLTSYTYQDFLADWGPAGFYGPVKSYEIVVAENPKDGSGVIIVVSVSPFDQFPEQKDTEKQRRTKEVRLWVERRDNSISFAP
jgi:hypothetical protein